MTWRSEDLFLLSPRQIYDNKWGRLGWQKHIGARAMLFTQVEPPLP